jgi:hypothetical protein
MRSIKAVVFGVLSVLSVAGCNSGQPRIYRVALDEGTPIQSSCRKDSTTSNPLVVTQENFRAQDEWVVWDGASTQYLDLGKQEWKLGDAPKIEVEDLIEGSNKVFTATRFVTLNVPGLTEKRTTQVSVTWSDFGAAPTGTIDLQARYECQGCPVPNPAPDAASCSTTIKFSARRIDAAPTTEYGNNP